LRQVAEFLQAPVMTTMAGKSGFPENHPLSVGTGATSIPEGVHHYLTRSDLVFGIGCSFSKTNFGAPIPPGKVVIHSTNDDTDINKDYKCQHPLVGDSKLVLRQLLEELKRQAGSEGRSTNQALHDEIGGIKQRWLDRWMPKLTSNETPINPYRVVWDLMHTVDLDNVIVTHESGSAREYMVPFWEARDPRSFIGWGKSTQLGYSLGLAMGAKMAAPEKQVINVMGDFAFGSVGMDIETAVRANLPIITIVLNNSTMAIYDDSRMPVSVQRYNIKGVTGQFSEVAQALGAYSEKITDPQEIVPAIRRAIEVNRNGQTVLLEFITKEEGEYSKFQW
jgi:acetolactate synthase-1/2/3 large subunit